MNVERIRQIAADIRAAAQFHMGRYWFENPTHHDCGTPACIAGFACFRYDDKKLSQQETDDLDSTTYQVARDALDLTTDQAYYLFDAIGGGAFTVSSQITAETAARTLEHLADTGEVVWQTEIR